MFVWQRFKAVFLYWIKKLRISCDRWQASILHIKKPRWIVPAIGSVGRTQILQCMGHPEIGIGRVHTYTSHLYPIGVGRHHSFPLATTRTHIFLYTLVV